MRYFQRVTGGYKVYDSTADAKDRWYFNFVVEVPRNLLKAGEVVYQWISWDETTQGVEDPEVGAVACKTEVGNPISTEAIQWFTKQNMACSGKEVQNKKWFMQLAEGKLKTAFYQAFWWNTVNYQLVDTDREVILSDGTKVQYATQTCEVEIVLAEGQDVTSDKSYALEFGSRFYKDNDAKVMDCAVEKFVDWFQPVLEFSPELKETPEFNEDDQVAVENDKEANDFSVAESFTTRLDSTSDSGAVSKQGADLKANQEYTHGYNQFPKLTESDFWWWYLAIDAPDSLMKTGDVIYQYLTINTGSSQVKDAAGAITTKENYETIGCYVVVGADPLASSIDQYLHPAGESWSLNSKDAASADNAAVVGKKYSAQNPTIKQYTAD